MSSLPALLQANQRKILTLCYVRLRHLLRERKKEMKEA